VRRSPERIEVYGPRYELGLFVILLIVGLFALTLLFPVPS
jgi:hypothetical protein